MAWINRSIRVKPFFCRTMVSGNNGGHARLAGRLEATPQVGIHGFHCFFDGSFIFGVPQNVDVGKGGQAEIYLRVLYLLDYSITPTGSVHLRLLVKVGNVLGGGDCDSLFSRKGIEDLPVEKVTHMN